MKRTGYKVVRVPFDKSTGKARGEYEDFVTGFVTPDGKVWGRPVGITVAKDGSLLISEDGNKTIWRVSYAVARAIVERVVRQASHVAIAAATVGSHLQTSCGPIS